MLEKISDEALVLKVKELEAIIDLHTLYSKTPICFHSLNNEGLFVDVNQNELDLLEYSRDEVVNKLNIMDILTPESRDIFADIFPIFKIQGFVNNLELDFIKKRGLVLPVVINSIANYDEKEHFTQSNSIVLDNTNHRKAKLAVHNSEEKYRQLFEFLPVGLTISDLNGNIVAGNKEAECLLKLSVRNQSARRVDDQKWHVIHLDGSPMISDEIPGIMALKQMRRIENVELGIKDDDGNITWLNVTAAPLPGKDGVIIAYSNINEKVEREKKLKEYSDKMKEASAMKDRFFSIIAHDLKNPFNSIMGFSDLLLNNLENYDQTKIRQFVSIIDQSAKHTLELLDNLLLWTRLQTGRISFIPSTMNLITVVRDNVELVISQASQKRIQITIKSGQDTFIHGDKNMIDTIVRNLLTNAIKFTRPEGMVVISLNENCHNIELSIQDNGVGIEPENLKNLFKIDNMFTQAGTAKEDGTGLGLILCKDFIERHGGEIRVDSKFGIGSTFTVIFPKKYHG
jgi:PAS domain S-box-containing protein